MLMWKENLAVFLIFFISVLLLNCFFFHFTSWLLKYFFFFSISLFGTNQNRHQKEHFYWLLNYLVKGRVIESYLISPLCRSVPVLSQSLKNLLAWCRLKDAFHVVVLTLLSKYISWILPICDISISNILVWLTVISWLGWFAAGFYLVSCFHPYLPHSSSVVHKDYSL